MPDFPGKDEWIVSGNMEKVRHILRDIIVILLVLMVSGQDRLR